MAYKSILTVVTETKRSPAALAAAAQLCQNADAHLEALALGIDPNQVDYAALGAGVAMLRLGLERAEAEARAHRALAETALAAHPLGLRSSVETAICPLGGLTELVAAHARYADLVVLGKPYGSPATPEAEAVLEAALFDGMAPVLVVPESGLPAARPKRIMLAWNQSREALTATRRALPLLKQAEKVTITVVDPSPRGAERSDPGGQLCQLLVRHGVRAEVSVLARSLPRISDVLHRACRDAGADLLVMGAYGHSRFRQAILGGATRNMLEQAELPVFMAH
ncbi:universal stress protein [Xinfangfangia sp. CPCC 101601]|uniref:Universal stress protein n=1 Tax=Pseudogemmobacter lacusdianii TaxID=3069608 RepID=A0ABU0VW23_9RHOB|nr:universal stress protein [Xinfangfangia sp. CPCC 101601]MDQ2065937.1 universal stress protein [Xinfangfangia sp. CPCC 101601]